MGIPLEVVKEYSQKQSAWAKLPPDKRIKVCITCKKRKVMDYYALEVCSDCDPFK